jgi:hypothetical protein
MEENEKPTIQKKDGIVLTDKTIEDIHLSPSQINTFKRCQAVWYFRYIKGIKTPPSAAMMLGSCFDDAVSTNYDQKIQTKEDMKTDDVIDAFNKSFGIRKDETDFTLDSKEDTRNDGQRLIKEYQREVAPSIQPTAVQRRYDLKFEGVDWKLVAISDVETEDLIIDNKTSARSPAEDKKNGGYTLSPDHLFQIYTYGIARMKIDRVVPKLRIDYSIRTKVAKIIQAIVKDITQPDIDYFNKITGITYRQMELLRQDIMPPLPDRGNMLCSKRHCGYWQECQKLFGGNIKD